LVVALAVVGNTACAAATAQSRLASADANIAAPSVPHLPARATSDPKTSDPMTISVYPRIMSAGGYASVRLRIPQDVLSRSVEISWWSQDGLGGSHLVEIEGERSASRHEFPIKNMEPGEYEITAILHRRDGSRVRRSTTMIVVGTL
jgi:hypothetical protein